MEFKQNIGSSFFIQKNIACLIISNIWQNFVAYFAWIFRQAWVSYFWRVTPIPSFFFVYHITPYCDCECKRKYYKITCWYQISSTKKVFFANEEKTSNYSIVKVATFGTKNVHCELWYLWQNVYPKENSIIIIIVILFYFGLWLHITSTICNTRYNFEWLSSVIQSFMLVCILVMNSG